MFVRVKYFFLAFLKRTTVLFKRVASVFDGEFFLVNCIAVYVIHQTLPSPRPPAMYVCPFGVGFNDLLDFYKDDCRSLFIICFWHFLLGCILLCASLMYSPSDKKTSPMDENPTASVGPKPLSDGASLPFWKCCKQKIESLKKTVVNMFVGFKFSSFFTAFLKWKPTEFFKEINTIIDGWSLFFHLLALFTLYWTFSSWWHPLLNNWPPRRLLSFGPLDFFTAINMNWVWFWTIVWYSVILFALIWAHRWTPDPTSGWIKPPMPYWKWCNQKFLFFLPQSIREADEELKGKLYVVILLFLFYFFYRDYLFLHHTGIYRWFFEEQHYPKFPWYAGYSHTNPGVFIDVPQMESFRQFFWLLILSAMIPFQVIFWLSCKALSLSHTFFQFCYDKIGVLFLFNDSGWLTLIFGILLYFITQQVSPFKLLMGIILFMINAILLLFSIKIEFFSILILIIYIGAISILFLFVIMLLDLREENELPDKNKFLKLVFFATFCFLFDAVLETSKFELKVFEVDMLFFAEVFGMSMSDIFVVGSQLYTNELIILVFLSIILLVAMIGAIAFLILLD